jgi:undecaprenyl-diphosphatase
LYLSGGAHVDAGRSAVARAVPAVGSPHSTGRVRPVDWSIFHLVNSGVATRDWLEDPISELSGAAVMLYGVAIIALWFVARPYGKSMWKLASASGLVAAAIAMMTNQIISHLWDRPRPLTAHAAATHLLAAPSPDPSFPSDHAAAAFAIAFAVLAFSRRAGIGFLVAAALIALSRIALGLHYPSDVLAGAVVGWAAALLVTTLGSPWIGRLVAVASRISDPLLKPLWDRLPRRPSVRD